MNTFSLKAVVENLHRYSTIDVPGWCQNINHHLALTQEPIFADFWIEQVEPQLVKIGFELNPSKEQLEEYTKWTGSWALDKRIYYISIERKPFESGARIRDDLLKKGFRAEAGSDYHELFDQVQKRVVYIKAMSQTDEEIAVLRPSVMHYTDIENMNLGVSREIWDHCVTDDPEETALNLMERGEIDDPDFWIRDVFDAGYMIDEASIE